MKLNITKEQKLKLCYRALECIAENLYLNGGLCFLLSAVKKEQNLYVDIYDCLSLDIEDDFFVESRHNGFEEITNQMIGKKAYKKFFITWFPIGDWKSREEVLLNAIKILENERTV